MDFNYIAELLFPNVTMTEEELEAKYPVRNLKEGAIVSRMAPSPTGFVHLGNLVQGITSERLCHQSGGTLFLRVEDTDQKREVAGAVEILIDTLKYYNINFDEGATIEGDNGIYAPYRQRQRKDIYHVYAKRLVKEGKAYPCFCTEDELAEMHEQQEKLKENFGYYGKWAKWRDRTNEEIETELKAGKPWVLRFRSTGSIENKIKFTDYIKGNLEVTENDIDHVLLKSDGIPTYHFAHAVDDHLMRTTHVVRGDEWLSTLPFHIQLFSALGFRLPKYLHIGPLMKMDGESKRKLSKRKDPELALSYYKQEGYPAQSLYEYILTILNSNYEDWRRANPTASTEEFKFSYKKMNPAGSLFDGAKLLDVSKNVISRMSAEDVYNGSTEWAGEYDKELYSALTRNPEYTKAIFSIGRGGKNPRKDIALWSEVRSYVDLFYDELFKVQDEYSDKFSKNDIKITLQEFTKVFDIADDSNTWFEKIKDIADMLGYASDMRAYKQNPEAYKGNVSDISMFIRLAVTGKLNSPDMYSVMQILGYETVIKRVNEMIKSL
ncbi:MAG: glutamate--tRNA ligase [Clostridia bacterium]|nr:glutamate--tRNA ligase [Clostridia bacterium]MBQ7788103.1 glutamate--tRNA ligase [Clostridia bacterium]